MDDKSENTETPDSAVPTSSEKLSPTGVASMQGETKGNGDWVDRGIVEVPVDELPEPDDVASAADFNHHISWEDAQVATKRLPEIQAQVNAGKTGDDFSAADQAKGLDPNLGNQGDRAIYDLYYGSDPVYLNKIGSEYQIISGRHRVFAAKEAGLSTIPARVHEKVTK